MSTSFEQFTAMQNALSELNYSQPLLRESVPLVQAIFTDLIEVTKKYTQLRKQAEIKQKGLESQLNPIKIENDNLTKSNNTLHLKIIEGNDKFQNDLKNIERECESLRMAKNELNVLLNQKKSKIKTQQIMIGNLKKKMNAIIGSNGTNHKQLIGKTAQISFNSNLLSPSKFINHKSNVEFEEKEREITANEYVLLESENESLLKQIAELTKTGNTDQESIIDLQNKLKSRNEEINRIHNNVQIDDNRIQFIKHKQESENQTNKMQHFESQIEVLQNEMLTKEKIIKEYAIKDEIIEKLKKENIDLNNKLEITWQEMDKLKSDLCKFKHSSKALKLEKKYDILKSSKKLNKNVSEINFMQNKIDELKKLNKVLQNKLDSKSKQHSVLSGKNKEEMSNIHLLNTRLELKEKEVTKLRNEQTNLLQNYDELKNKINEFEHKYEINNNNKNNLEIQLKSMQNKFNILNEENGLLQGKYDEMKGLNNANQSLNKELNMGNEELKFKLRCLEKENESMNERVIKIMNAKNECESKENLEKTEKFELVKKLQNMEFKTEDLLKEKEWNNSLMIKYQTQISKFEKNNTDLNANIAKLNKLLECEKLKCNEIEYKYNTLMKENESVESRLKQSENMIQSLKVIQTEFQSTEKNKNNLELQLVQSQNENDKLTKDNRISENSNKRKEETLNKIQKEKNSLKVLLQEMQQRISAFQQRLAVITNDRDQIKQSYDNLTVEMDNKNEIINNLNLNLNDLKAEYNNLTNECKNLSKKHSELTQAFNSKSNVCQKSMNKIKEFNEIQNKLNQTLSAEIKSKQELNDNIFQINKERDEIINKYDILYAKYNKLNDEIVPNLNQELILSQVKNGELKVLCTKLDEQCKTAQTKIQQIYHKNKELSENINRNVEEFNKLNNQLSESYKNQTNMKSALEKLVNKHDSLQNELDTNAETIQRLNHTIGEQKSQNEEFQIILSETQDKYRRQQKQLSEYDNKLKFNTQLLHRFQKEIIPSLKEEMRLKTEQLKNCENNINNITKENQFLNNEYAMTINDRDTKNNQLSNALNKILFLESSFKNLQNEKGQILENYKSVVLENEKLQNLSQLLNKNKSDFTYKISVLEQHIMGRDNRIKGLETKLTEANLSNHELHRQSQVITRDLHRSALNNNKHKMRSENLQKDLRSMNEQVVKRQSDQIDKKNRTIVQFKKENEKLQQIINQLNLEKEIAGNSLNNAQGKMIKLEEIINNLRIDNVSNHEICMKDKDQSTKLKLQLNQIKDLNEKLNSQLQKVHNSTQ